MKLRFIQDCKDKITGNMYYTNAEYVFDDERAKEILATGYAEVVEGKNVPKKDEKEQQKEIVPSNKEKKSVEERMQDGEIVNLYTLTKKELEKLAKEKGVATSGTKEEIIERLLAD